MLCACGGLDRPAHVPNASSEALRPASESIGVATMSDDGVIRLQLRADGANGEVGDALLTYTPDNPDYASVIAHLGGIAPGETKPVPPWPD
jgi:hypothetical protein